MAYTIETSQNVYLEYEPAQIGNRIGAQMLDHVFRFVYLIVVMIVISAFRLFGSYISFIILFSPVYLYTLLFETFMHGQTPGKFIVKIKVIQIDGEEPSFWNYFLRWLVGIVDFAVFGGLVAIITIAINKKGQRLGDILAGTSVVNTERKDSLEKTGYVEVPEGYQPTFQEAIFLIDKDLKIVAAIVAKLRKDDSLHAYDIAQRAKSKLEQKIHSGRKIDMAADVYLETLLKDYNYLNSNPTR